MESGRGLPLLQDASEGGGICYAQWGHWAYRRAVVESGRGQPDVIISIRNEAIRLFDGITGASRRCNCCG
jgi:hypothetical protein